MITSRLSAVAATFAVFATATLAFAVELRQDEVHAAESPVQVVRTVVELPRVEISAKRLPAEQV
jgi:hypothetical protein